MLVIWLGALFVLVGLLFMMDERRKFAYHALGKEPPAWKRSAH